MLLRDLKMSRARILTGRSERSMAHFEARKRIFEQAMVRRAAPRGLRISAGALFRSNLSPHQIRRVDLEAVGRGVAHTRPGASDSPPKRRMGAWGAP